MQNDVVFVKSGTEYDWLEISPECDYVVENIEPFLDVGFSADKKKLGTSISAKDNNGVTHFFKIKDLVQQMKVYYAGNEEEFDSTPFEERRAPGLVANLLDEVDMFVVNNKVV